MPVKTLFKISDPKYLEERRNILDQYLKILINRKDLRTNLHFRKFIDFESHFENSKVFHAQKIGVLQNYTMGVRDIIYLPQYKTAFVAQSDMNVVTRLDSYFTNLKMSIKSGKNLNLNPKAVLMEDAASIVGSVQHFEIKIDKSKEDEQWTSGSSHWGKTYGSQTNVLHWDDKSSVLFVGLDSGMIHRYEC